jgi:uncharacterized protein YdhG (YjbR/CyaY superfamily)
VGTVTDYLATVDPVRRPALERVVARAYDLVPDLQEGLSYGMPALLYRGKPILAAMAAKGHLALYPYSGGVVKRLGDRLAGFSLSTGTIRFQPDAQLPDDVIDDVVRFRQQEIDEQLARPPRRR